MGTWISSQDSYDTPSDSWVFNHRKVTPHEDISKSRHLPKGPWNIADLDIPPKHDAVHGENSDIVIKGLPLETVVFPEFLWKLFLDQWLSDQTKSGGLNFI